jgi:hypothetical protein
MLHTAATKAAISPTSIRPTLTRTKAGILDLCNAVEHHYRMSSVCHMARSKVPCHDSTRNASVTSG